MKKTIISLALALAAGALTLSAETTTPEVVHPTVVKKVIPDYPEGALRSGVEGTVIIEGLVTRHGMIEGATVVAADSPELADAAVRAVRSWEFTPMTTNGEATDTVVRIPVHFSLNRSEDGSNASGVLASR